jgi:EXS family
MFSIHIYQMLTYLNDSLPYLIRLRQCIVEYGHQGNTRSLQNALKYATAFPVIYLSAAQHIVEEELVKQKGLKAIEKGWHGEHHLFRLWLVIYHFFEATYLMRITGYWQRLSILSIRFGGTWKTTGA